MRSCSDAKIDPKYKSCSSLVSNITQSASSQFYNLWLSDVLDVLFSPSLPMINVAVKMLLVFVVFNVIDHFL